MEKTVRFPFKFKIIFANFILVFLFLTINIGINLKKNQTEKENYLFDSIYNFSKEIQSQLQNDFQAVSTYSSMMLQIIDSLEKESLDESLKMLPLLLGGKSFKKTENQIQLFRSFGEDFSISNDLIQKLYSSKNIDTFFADKDHYLWITCREKLSMCLMVKVKFNFGLSGLDEEDNPLSYVVLDKFKNHIKTKDIKLIDELKKIDFNSQLSIKEVSLNNETYIISKSNFSLGSGYLFVFTPLKTITSEIRKILEESIALAGILLSLSLLFSLILSSYFTKALNVLMKGVEEVSKANYEIELKSHTKDEFNLLIETFNLMVKKIKEYIIQMEKSLRMEQEIKLASLLQDSFIPSKGLDNNFFKISGFYKPATECAGDVWGHQYFNDKLLFYIGDVTGHGLSSAFVTAATSSVFSLFQDFVKNKPSILQNPSEIFYYLNKVISYIGGGKLMMTCFVGVYDTKTKKLYFSNSSHDFPIHIKASNEVSPILTKTDYRLGEKNSPEFQTNSLQLSPGDRILLYTDGLVENKNLEGKNLSEGDLFRIVRRKKKLLNVETVVESYQNNLKDSPPQDDLTVVMLEIK